MPGTTSPLWMHEYVAMAKAKSKKPKIDGTGWHAQEWLDFVGKSQADFIRFSHMKKSQVSELLSGEERFNRDHLYMLSAFIGCPPGAIVDINPTTKDGRIMAELLLARGKTG